MTRESYLIGYARVSQGDDQSNATQRRALDALGCKRVFEATASGGRWDRPKLLETIGQLRAGEVVGVVTRGRVSCSLETVLELPRRNRTDGAGFWTLIGA